MEKWEAATPALKAHEFKLLAAYELVIENLEVIVGARWRSSIPLYVLVKPAFIRDSVLAWATPARAASIETYAKPMRSDVIHPCCSLLRRHKYWF